MKTLARFSPITFLPDLHQKLFGNPDSYVQSGISSKGHSVHGGNHFLKEPHHCWNGMPSPIKDLVKSLYHRKCQRQLAPVYTNMLWNHKWYMFLFMTNGGDKKNAFSGSFQTKSCWLDSICMTFTILTSELDSACHCFTVLTQNLSCSNAYKCDQRAIHVMVRSSKRQTRMDNDNVKSVVLPLDGQGYDKPCLKTECAK